MQDFFDKLPGTALSASVIHAGLNLLVALLILLVGIWVAARMANFSRRALQRANVDNTLSSFLRKVIYGVLVAMLIVMAFTRAGVPSAPLVAALGAGGLAIGLALQGSLSNLAWGVLLVIFRPFRAGDFVTVDADPRVLKDPEPGVWTVGLGESKVDLIMRAWTVTADFWATQTDLLRAIKEHLDATGISIPFPQRELTIVRGDLPGGAPRQG